MEQTGVVLCDTNILIEFYKGNESFIQQLHQIGQDNIAVSVITVGELIYGAFNKREQKQIEKDLAHLRIVKLDHQVCDIFTHLMSTYSLSHNLQVPDAFIAATAIRENLPLYTLNLKDFKYIEGLRLYTP